MRKLLFTVLIFFAPILVGLQVFGPLEGLTVVTSKGAFEFMVDIADNPKDQVQGLMCQEQLPEDCATNLPENYGMLFDFGNEQPRGFWMKNTYIPLDIIFIRSNGTVASIGKDAKPLDDKNIIQSGAAVRFVLEVEAGVANKIGLKVGDKVKHSRIQ